MKPIDLVTHTDLPERINEEAIAMLPDGIKKARAILDDKNDNFPRQTVESLVDMFCAMAAFLISERDEFERTHEMLIERGKEVYSLRDEVRSLKKEKMH